MKARKNKAGKKNRQMRELPKRKKDMTEAQAKSVKGGFDGGGGLGNKVLH